MGHKSNGWKWRVREHNDAGEVAAALAKVESDRDPDRHYREAYFLAVRSQGRYRVSLGDAMRRGASRAASIPRPPVVLGWRRFLLGWGLVAFTVGLAWLLG